MKKLIFLLFICLLGNVKSFSQFVADLDGFPLITTGWNIGGFGTVVDSTVRLTSPSTTQNGYVYYNTPVNLTGCGQFTVDFDYRIQVSPSSTVADGIAFWYISNPPSGFVSGGGIGLPSNPNGLLMILDTYNNTAPMDVPLATLLGYDGSIPGYTEGSTAGLLAPVAPTLTYITDGTWRHCKITYNVGTVNVYFNYSATPTLTGFYPLTISGYFGFSSSTGAAYSTQSVKSIHITALVSLPVPVVPAATVTYCQGDVATALTATPVSGATIRWFDTDTGTVIALPTAPMPNTSVPGTTTYYVRQTAGTCISQPDSVKIIVNPKPEPPELGGTTVYCQDDVFTPFTTTGLGILWYTTATGGVGTAVAPIVPTAIPGTYKYYASQTVLGCESDRDSISVVVHPTSFTPVLTGGLLTYCQYAPFVPFTVTGTNVRWYTTPTGGISSSVAPLVNTSVAGTYDFYVTQTDTTGCESDRLHLPVVVFPEPPAPTVAPISYCQYTLSVPLIAGGIGLAWYGPGVAPGSPVAPNPSTALTGNDTFYVTQTIDGCVGDSAMLVVAVDSTPVSPVAYSNSPVCEGDTLHLVASSLTDSVSFLWEGPNSFIATESNPYIANLTLAAGGFYTVTAALGGCTSTAVVNVVVTPLPTVAITSNSPLCSGVNDTLYLQATGDPGTLFTWSGPYTFSSNAQNPFRTPVSEEYEGTYVVSVFFNGCTNIATHNVVVNPTPTPPWVKWLTYCQYYDAPYLQAFGSNILWYTSSDPTLPGSSVPPKPQTNIVGYSFYYANQTVDNCPSMIDSIRVVVNPTPTITVSADTTVCPHDSVYMFAASADGGAYFRWSPQQYLDDTVGTDVIARPITNMNYRVVTSNTYGCTDTGYINVTVKPAAVVHLEDSVTLYPGETYQINPETNCTSYFWSPSGGLNGKYISNPIASPIISTKYVLTGVTEWGCATKDSINVNVADDALIIVPNAFAPGGVNGKFKVSKRGIATLENFKVYDRWGVVVYEGKDIDDGWDGTYKGVPQPLGVYIYEINAITTKGKPFRKVGNVTLLR